MVNQTTMDVDPIDITSDGGVLKKVLVEGKGTETPPEGSTVHVHYVGTLTDGTEFDSSRGRGEPFTFKLGKGNVIKGWDKGVATMKLGEKSILTCRSDYAYGKAGSPPKIPADATLNFEVELLKWVDGDDVSGDGEVIKRTIEAGKGWKHPKNGERTTLTYKGELANGTVVDDHWETAFEIVLGEDHAVPEAVHLALKSMSEGETARVQSTPRYANAGVTEDVTYTVNLVGWREKAKVGTEGGITREIVVKGDGYQTPNEGATVTILIGEGVDGETSEQTVVLGEGKLPMAVEMAIMEMKKGERDEVHVEPHQQDPDMETVGTEKKIWQIELKDFQKAKESWSMNADEKLEHAENVKATGTEFFKQGKIRIALRCYKRAGSLLQAETDMSDEQKKKRQELLTSIYLNLALCFLKLNRHKEVIENCDKVLKMDKDNFKALSRRGLAFVAVNDFESANRDMKRALEIEPNDKGLKRELAALHMKMKKQEEKEKMLFAKMFAA